jgi:hypothetical protein
MEKKKPKLEELKVNSFVTSLDKNENQTVEGGAFLTVGTPWSTPVCTVTLISAMYTIGKSIGSAVETTGDVYSRNLCGDSMGFWCKIITV